MKLIKFLFCICILISGNVLVAATLSVKSVGDAVSYGLKNNPMINVQYQVLQATRNLPEKMGSLSDLKLGLRLNGMPAKDPGYFYDQKRIFLNQSFPFPGELGRKYELGMKSVSVSGLDVLMVKNNVVLSIKSLYYNLVLNKELITITENNAKIIENIINITDIKYRSGKTLQANILKAKVSKGKVEEKILQLTHQKVMLVEELKKWLGVSDTDFLSIDFVYPKFMESTISSANAEIVSDTLMVRKAIAVKDRSDQLVLVEKDRYLPDFSAQVDYWDNSGMDNQYGAQLAMTLPWFNSRNSASVNEADSLSEANRSQVIENQHNMKRILVTLLSDLKTTQKMVRLYEDEILKNAELSLSSFQNAFEVDKASFLDYFESEKTLFSLEMDYAKLVNRTHIIHAKLNSFFEKGVN
ncbi:TolC family protein [bacterium]|nr:TolC family protein [bacterium]